MPKRRMTGVAPLFAAGDELTAFAAIVEAEWGTDLWPGGAGAAETEIVPPLATQAAPGFAWSAEHGYGDPQDWPDADELDESLSLTQRFRLMPPALQRSWVGVCCAAIIGLSVCAVVAVLIVKGWPSDDGGSAVAATTVAAPPAVWTPTAAPTPYCAPGHNADTGCLPVVAPTATATQASAVSYTPLVGDWQGHHHWMTVYPDGVLELHVQDYPAAKEHCTDSPPMSPDLGCSEAGTPKAVVHIALTAAPDPGAYGHYYALGVVKDSSDSREVAVGAHVRVDVENATDYHARVYPNYPAPGLQGKVATLSFDGREYTQNPYCDAASSGCG